MSGRDPESRALAPVSAAGQTPARQLTRTHETEALPPIPVDVQPGPGWTGQMLEMASHIGAYDTLRIVAVYGGQYIYITVDPNRNPFRDLVGREQAEILSRVYGAERIRVPTAKSAIARAQRAPIIAAVRAGRLTGDAAARMLGTSRTYLAHLVNGTDEGDGTAPMVVARDRGRHYLPGQLDMFEE